MSIDTNFHGQTGRLIRALRRDAALAGIQIEPVVISEEPWASATFDGSRVMLRCATDGDVQPWLACLPEAELDVHGALVADLAVELATPGSITLAILLIAAR
ncbi:hypothetical protein D9601_07155 [Sphingomonas sp. MA1305]|uniref:hypothetical protein n=1 Tax=Sphingomonas sp. MA1305 TaxID=2479204 RepID=UPI0018DFDAFF|nr:hypothetical protein [Sphingomonas sp. MA1305]MBI0475133.1 hypothetical protein [Sphingomonas sp. MA1305]